MDRHYIAVAPNMVEPLASIGITVADHVLYLIVTPRGGLRIIPDPRPQRGRRDERMGSDQRDGALIDGIDGWVRMYTDRENGAYKSFPAPAGRFGEPKLAGDQAREDVSHGVPRQGPPDRQHRTRAGAEVGGP